MQIFLKQKNSSKKKWFFFLTLRCEINIKPIKIYVPHKSRGVKKFSGDTGVDKKFNDVT